MVVSRDRFGRERAPPDGSEIDDVFPSTNSDAWTETLHCVCARGR